MNKKINKKGFTLIEVVLTIAIGALIFLLAFLAFGNARVNQRDSQRRADLDKIAGEISNFAGDNGGGIPRSEAQFGPFVQQYFGSAKDPSSGSTYFGIAVYGYATTPAPAGMISYAASTGAGVYVSRSTIPNAQKFCDNTTDIPTSGTNYAVRMALEKGVACRDSR